MCVRKEEAVLEWVIQWCDNTGTEKDCDTVAESVLYDDDGII